MTTKNELVANVDRLVKELEAAQGLVDAFDDLPENNVFATMEEAEGKIEDALLDRASSDCEGSYNCGTDTYTREFSVDGKRYLFTLTCEYNRHDKQYYYVDGHSYTVAPL